MKPQRIFYGWWIVLAGLLVSYYVIGTFFYGFTTFFNPIAEEFGWTRAMVAGAFSLQAGEFAAVGPFAGMAIDRFGPRKVMLVGITVTGIGLFGLSSINSLWGFYTFFLMSALGLTFGSTMPSVIAVSNWFDRKRGRALAVLSMGAGLGGTLAPFLVMLINAVGWRTALRGIGLGIFLVGVPSSLIMRRSPEEYGLIPDGEGTPSRDGNGEQEKSPQQKGPTLKEGIRTVAFWKIGIASGLSFCLMNSIISNQIPALESFGVDPERGAFVIAIMTVASLAGRWIGGTIGDFVDKRYILATASILQLLGGLVFANIHTFWHAVLFAILLGSGFGALVPTRPGIQAQYFGRRAFGSLMGIMLTITALGGAPGPIFAGWMYDHFHSYRLAFILMSFLQLITITLYLTVKPPHWPTLSQKSAGAGYAPLQDD